MSVKRNTIYNLLGSIAPSLVSLVTVPAYLHLIGYPRYGVLAIVWLFLGYFGLFDPGITRAAAFHIARLHEPKQAKEREGVFWTALVVNLAFGMIGAVVLYFAARPVFMSTFKMPESMRGEVIASLPWLAASIPLSTVTGVLGGALQAREWFGVSNSLNVANAAISQLIPLAVAFWMGPQLNWLIPATIIARSLGAVPSFVVIARALPLGKGGRFDRLRLKSLFSYGGWITLTNVLNPVLSTMDRILIGSLLSAEAVAFYTVPFNLVSRASAVPGALTTTLFPKFSRGNQEDSARLASDGLAALASVMTPMVVLGIAAFPIFMRYWVGLSFAQHAAPVGIVLLVGIWINGLSYIPYSHLQASGRPDLVAKFHAIELLPFLGFLWLGVHYFGLLGAAYAWTFRVGIDGILLFAAAGRVPHWRRLFPGGLLVLAAALLAPSAILSGRMGLELLVLAPTIIWSWKLSPNVRAALRIRAGKIHLRAAV
ncbi:flippase [Alloacidobacterium sp.]|uniref:flippase n=1 Tax=Alloacidobacterium sp. TaxID=2951999 RepID=UPI002D6472B9|nr:flippase [Alloacidobacterium sp.]HYK36964.1 flippase [Alloacidobacterium sp.]